MTEFAAPLPLHESNTELQAVFSEVDIADPAVVDELYAFDRLIQDKLQDEGHAYWYEPMTREEWVDLVKDSHTYALRHAQDGIVGYVSVAPLSDVDAERCYIMQETTSLRVLNVVTLAAHPPGKGYGQQLLQKVDEIALADGYSDVRLYVSSENKPARKLYEKAGYEWNPNSTISFRYYPNRISDEHNFKAFYTKHMQDLPPGEKEEAFHAKTERIDRLHSLNKRLFELCLFKQDTVVREPIPSAEQWQVRVTACMGSFLEQSQAASLKSLTDEQRVKLMMQLRQHNLIEWYYKSECGGEGLQPFVYLSEALGVTEKELTAVNATASDIIYAERAKYYRR